MIKTIFKTLVALLAVAMVFSCEKPPIPELSVSGDINDIPAAGATVKIEVTSNVAWTVDVIVDWILVDKTSGENNGVINVTVLENKEVRSRGVVLSIDCEEHGLCELVELNQLGAGPKLSVSPENGIDMPVEGGTAQVAVTSNVPWTVDIVVDWVTADKLSGENNGIINLQVQKNNVPVSRGVVIVIENAEHNLCEFVELTQPAAAASAETDRYALMAVYNASDGANWKESRRWDLSKDMKDWPGVKLNSDGRVIELSITNGTVSTVDWELPAEIAYLTELEIFQAVGSRVKGDFPEFLYGLTKLTKIVVNGNNITGSLSAKVSQWPELTNLYVNNNPAFGGTLPVELSGLKKLINLNISQTAISGALPAELSGCAALQNMMAFSTQISSIPDNWDKWPALKIVQLYDNQKLEGAVPASFGNAGKLTSLWLYGCNFTGNIPESFGNLPATCTQFRIQGNKLKGVVPAAVKAHANWTKWKADTYILPQQDGYGLTVE